ncbi:type I restriction endonuclease subunit S [Escherichia fergusonii]|nr:type I restriction endonuclease subunit S [Escherichia fergusonii]
MSLGYISGSLPQEWETPFLKDMVYPKQWKTISVKDLTPSGYTVYGANGKIGFYSEYTHENPTIMLTCRGATCGNIHISEPFSYINGNAMALDNQPINLIGLHFLKYALQARGLEDTISGSAQPQITRQGLEKVQVPLPPLAEQKIIAEKLDTLLAQVDSTKARLEQIPQILKRFRQAILATAMNGKLTEDWKKDNPSLFTKWNKSNIGELAQVATGKTPKRTDDRYWENGTIPWLTSSSTGKIFVENADQFISDIALRECTLKIFSPGTLLLAMYGEGKTRGQVTELKISATCNQACAAIICDEDKINRQFLKMRLMENYQETRKVAAGGNQPNLNLNKVREIPILLPSLPEQREIVRRVEQLFAYADTIEKQVNNALARVNNLTQSILAKAFRGELTAQWRAENPELISGENSAAALLEKIKAERAASGGKKASRKKS